MTHQSRSGLGLVCLASGAWYGIFIARATLRLPDGRIVYSLFDDAMISMQYARSLADGYGLRWNPGDSPVEGFSNLLWTLVMAAIQILHLPDQWATLPVAILGAVILIGVVWMAGRTAATIAGSRAGVYAAILAATCYPLVFWTLRGMEVGLLALLLLLLVRAFVDGSIPLSRRLLVAAGASAAMVLTRDDGLVPATAVCIVGILQADADRRRIAWTSVAVIAVAVAAHLVWRHAYYGEWVPNTYYLKLTGSSIGDRLPRGITALLSVLTRQVGPLALIAGCELWRRRTSVALLVFAPFVAVCAYSVYVGGDAWEFLNFANRYVSTGLGPLCVLGGAFLASLDSEVDVPRGALIAVALGLLSGAAFDVFEKAQLAFFTPRLLWWAVLMTIAAIAVIVAARRIRRLPPAAAWIALLLVVAAGEGRALGAWLVGNFQEVGNDRAETAAGFIIRDASSPDATIAVMHAGSTPYFSHRRAIDLLGKSDRHIARLPSSGFYPGHDKMDLPYSLAMRPDIVVPLYAASEPPLRDDLMRAGYDRICAAYWVRHDTTLVDRRALLAGCR